MYCTFNLTCREIHYALEGEYLTFNACCSSSSWFEMLFDLDVVMKVLKIITK